ncbi:LacI family DNA-binding transcriptional regulator [Tistlia consotensis]|nr:LacI family DNA-binding transcriptional regulator [Tistlia consotensis]
MTIKDVARQAGVSPGSVSRVLNSADGVSPALRARVENAARRLGFELNIAAQAMRGFSTRTVSCHVSTIENPLVAEMVRAAEERLLAAGYIMIVHSTGYDEERELAALTSDRGRRVDGLISIAGPMTHERYQDTLARMEMPVVAVDRDFDWGDSICVDHAGGAAQAVRQLAGLGHRRIGLLTPSPGLVAARRRAKGYRAELDRLDLPLDESLIEMVERRADIPACMMRVLSRPEAPTALIVLSTWMLAQVLEYARESGLAIPQDLSLVTVGDSDLARFNSPGITAITWNLRHVGRSAAELLIERMEAHGAAPDAEPSAFRSFEVPTELVLRASCAPPRGTAEAAGAGRLQ